MQKKNKVSLLVAQVVVLLTSVVVYIIVRTYFIYHIRFTLFEEIFAVLFLLSETFLLVHSFAFFLDIVSEHVQLKHPQERKPGKDASVAILIPARHEPKEVVENTLLTCLNMAYENKAVYLLDDSHIESFKQEARELAESLDVGLFTRQDNRGAKAGLINDFMATMTEKYIAIFDADQNPMPEFLNHILPLLEGDDRLAFVQTPQFYTNTDVSPVALISNVQQAVFFEYVCEGKSSNESMFCCGTNVVIRRSALEDVSGFDEDSVTEDFATSLKMHMKHWKSLYHNKAYTFGMAPEDLGSYFKQQSRWAMGSFQLFRKLLFLFFTDFRALKPLQWFEYALSSSYYFVGVADFFLIAGPIMYIFFNIPSFFMAPELYVLTFVPYFLLSFLVYYSSMGKKKYSPIHIFKVQMLGMMTIPVYLRSAFLVLFNIKKGFQITPKNGARSVPYRTLWPQLFLWALHLTALTWGMLRFYEVPSLAIAMNLFWVGLHTVIFSGVFYFNKE
ncbi:MAG: glycosyltransferase [Chlorobiaceae bacterium]